MSKISSLFKFKRSKNTKRYAYYNHENQVQCLDDLVKVFNSKAKIEYTTNELIKHSGLALADINENSLLDILEDPDFILDDNDDFKNYKVLFYRRTVENFIFLLQFHFLKGNFVFVSNRISSKGVLTKKERADLILNMGSKYFDEELKLDLSKKFDIKLTDKANNFLKVIDEVDFRINYINFSAKNQQLINKHVSEIDIPEDDLQSRIGELL